MSKDSWFFFSTWGDVSQVNSLDVEPHFSPIFLLFSLPLPKDSALGGAGLGNPYATLPTWDTL